VPGSNLVSDPKYEEIRRLIISGTEVLPNIFASVTDVNVLVNLLKRLLSSAQPRLLDGVTTEQMAGMPDDQQSDAIGNALMSMSDGRKAVFKAVLSGLMPIIHNSAVNKMTTRNLALAFGPSLIPDVVTPNPIDIVTKTNTLTAVFEKMLVHEKEMLGE